MYYVMYIWVIMKALKLLRKRSGLSQRKLAAKASIAYKTLQLTESDNHDLKLSTLMSITKALGFPESGVESRLNEYIQFGSDTLYNYSLRIVENSEDSWKVWLFEFVDIFRREKSEKMIFNPPSELLSLRMKLLLTSTVESLCIELKIAPPSWVFGMGKLESPWFVSGFDSLKASALIESPAVFRKRNIFVLNNFLTRV